MTRKRARKAGYKIVPTETTARDICKHPKVFRRFDRSPVFKKKSTAKKALKSRNRMHARRGHDIKDKVIRWPPKCLVSK